MTELKKMTIEVDGKEVTLSVEDAEKLYELLARLLGKQTTAPLFSPYPIYVPPPNYGLPYVPPPQPCVPFDPGPVNPPWPNWTITC